MWELGYRWCTEEVACENKGRRAPSASQTERFQKKPTMLTTWPWMVAFIVKKKNTFLSSLQSLSCVWLFMTPWTAARQATLSITNSWSSLKLMSIGLVMPSNHLILCHPLLLLPSIFPSIRVFFNDLPLCIRCPKYWSFQISSSNEYSGLISFMICLISL